MGPNDVEIIRVFTKEAGGKVADITLDSSADAEVVVEVEAGSTVFGLGGQWKAGIVVKDLVDGTVIPFALLPTTATSGALSTAPWDEPAERFKYTITQADLAQHRGNLCRVYAYLLVGTNAQNYDASLAESPVFLILP